jgi:hypothetical protein
MDLDDQIEEIIYRFDWRRVKEVMDFLNWQWATCAGVPEIDDLQRCARDLLNQLTDGQAEGQSWRFIRTGGLVARLDVIDDEDTGLAKIWLSLSFELASCEPVGH